MSSELDILQQMNSIDLSTVETDFPLLASGVVSAQIQECDFRRDTERKGDSAKPYLYVNYGITSPWHTAGHDSPVKQLNPGDRGMTITERIYVGTYADKKTGETKWYGVDRIARLREAVLGKPAVGTKFQPAEVMGQTIQLRLRFDPAPKNDKTGEIYGPRTEVDGYVKRR